MGTFIDEALAVRRSGNGCCLTLLVIQWIRIPYLYLQQSVHRHQQHDYRCVGIRASQVNSLLAFSLSLTAIAMVFLQGSITYAHCSYALNVLLKWTTKQLLNHSPNPSVNAQRHRQCEDDCRLIKPRQHLSARAEFTYGQLCVRGEISNCASWLCIVNSKGFDRIESAIISGDREWTNVGI